MKYAIAAVALVALLIALFAIGGRDAPAPVPSAPPSILQATPRPNPPQTGAVPTGTPADFNPLASAEVKAAIHRALRTGETQRWIDGEHSGYAVPSQTRGANGCRAVRYTVDQQPDVPFESITACE